MTEPLSPAARAVLDAVRAVPILLNNQQERIAIAAALRAAADQVVPEHREHYPHTLDERWRKISAFEVRSRFLAIAAELEAR